jgi:hypothetical protein
MGRGAFERFIPGCVTRILKIPLAIGMMEDFVSWNYTTTGIFTVRSAYHIEWESAWTETKKN